MAYHIIMAKYTMGYRDTGIPWRTCSQHTEGNRGGGGGESFPMRLLLLPLYLCGENQHRTERWVLSIQKNNKHSEPTSGRLVPIPFQRDHQQGNVFFMSSSPPGWLAILPN